MTECNRLLFLWVVLWLPTRYMDTFSGAWHNSTQRDSTLPVPPSLSWPHQSMSFGLSFCHCIFPIFRGLQALSHALTQPACLMIYQTLLEPALHFCRVYSLVRAFPDTRPQVDTLHKMRYEWKANVSAFWLSFSHLSSRNSRVSHQRNLIIAKTSILSATGFPLGFLGAF